MSDEDDRLFLQKAAEKGDSRAQTLLGLWYFNGQNGQKDYVKAAEWFSKAAEQGDINAQSKLGLLYFTGQGVPEDRTEAKKWFSMAAGKELLQGDARSKFYMGLATENKTDAAEWFFQAAAVGDSDAVCELKNLAEQGNAKAQNKLSILYVLGRGVPKDETKSTEWFNKAVENGDPDALFYKGRGSIEFRKDYNEATKWFHMAAEKGHAEAQFNLGQLYFDGKDVSQNFEKAVEWFQKATAQGYEKAKGYLAKAENEKRMEHIKREERERKEREEREERKRKEHEHQEYLKTEEGQKWEHQLGEKEAEVKKYNIQTKPIGCLGYIVRIIAFISLAFFIYIIIWLAFEFGNFIKQGESFYLESLNSVIFYIIVNTVISTPGITYIIWLISRKRKKKLYKKANHAYEEALAAFKKAKDTYIENREDIR